MAIRMASIEVLDYRKDGEVEPRRVTVVNITQRWPIFAYGDGSGPTTLLSPSAEGDRSQPILDRWAELIRRQFNLLQPGREQRYCSHRCHRAQPNSGLPFRSIAR